MRMIVKNREYYENKKIVQIRTYYDEEAKKYYHERLENGKVVKEWVTEG